MSASIYWRYVHHDPQIDVAAPSTFVAAMTKCFGSYPWTLGQEQIATLQGLAALCNDGATKNPYQAIIDAIYGENMMPHTIEVWPEY